MKIKKIENKINLDMNVTAENDYECHHDCIVYYYSGNTSSSGCKEKSKLTSSTTTSW
jgi:hypothetical protein